MEYDERDKNRLLIIIIIARSSREAFLDKTRESLHGA